MMGTEAPPEMCVVPNVQRLVYNEKWYGMYVMLTCTYVLWLNFRCHKEHMPSIAVIPVYFSSSPG